MTWTRKNSSPTFKMPDVAHMVVNTGPMLAVTAALGDLSALQMYECVWVPLEVCEEMLAGGASGFGVEQFEAAQWLRKASTRLEIAPMLVNSLDIGEASVIQWALNQRVQTVCIDEATGRRVARLNGLSVTGSIGVLLRAKREGLAFSMRSAIQRMRARGVWLSQCVVDFALAQAGE